MAKYEDRVYSSVRIIDKVVKGDNPGWEYHIMTFDASNKRREGCALGRIERAGGTVDSVKEVGTGGWKRIVRWHTEGRE